MTTVLIAGGAGHIGSTVTAACLDAGITPVIPDSLVRGRREFTEGRVLYEATSQTVTSSTGSSPIIRRSRRSCTAPP
ncbi:hypothetical protein [Streptomyces sp. NPDC059783]|uniref:hypothetical protein n=1 Tax=Streptomyces sp. NPDC059783 TaxID=3346944 RepID=UPI0036635C77